MESCHRLSRLCLAPLSVVNADKYKRLQPLHILSSWGVLNNLICGDRRSLTCFWCFSDCSLVTSATGYFTRKIPRCETFSSPVISNYVSLACQWTPQGGRKVQHLVFCVLQFSENTKSPDIPLRPALFLSPFKKCRRSNKAPGLTGGWKTIILVTGCVIRELKTLFSGDPSSLFRSIKHTRPCHWSCWWEKN